MWAEPTTFGHKMAGFGFELIRAHHRLQAAAANVRYGKLSGPVGNHSTVPPGVEAHVVGALGLNAEPAATQVVGRDRHAAFLTTVAVVGATLERLATEIRHLSRSEVAEVAEAFTEGQKGSSAMPHKKNPILAENVTGLARLLRGYAHAGLENVALWHERDISHSSVERIVLPDACLALDFALARMDDLLQALHVDEGRMRSNLEAAAGSVFSQRVLLGLIRRGMSRDDAYRTVQEASAAAVAGGRTLAEALEEAGVEDSAADFSLDEALAHADHGVDLLRGVTPEWLRSGGESA